MATAQVANFPNHFVNPKEKGEDWIYQMVTAIYNEWGSQTIKSFERGVDRYRLNRLYSLGKQPIDIYKPSFEVAEDQDSSYINLDFSPPAIIPKFRRITNNRFAKIDFTINAEAIDQYALDDKSDYEAEERANIKVRQMLKELGIPDEVLNSGEVDQPVEEEELAIKMDYGYKHNQAIDIEKRIDAVFTHEKINEKLAVARDNGFDTGVYSMKVSTDETTGKIKIRIVEPENLIVSPTRDPFFKDIWYAGETTLLTIDEIRRTAESTGVDLNEQQLQELAEKNAGQYGNPKYYNVATIGSYAYDSCKVPVLDVEFLSCDKNWYEKRWTKRGPIIGKVAKPKESRKDREYMSDERTVVYRAKWVIGTKILFDYGLKSDAAARRNGNHWDTILSYKIVAPELNQMETSPMVEALIPITDQICLAWYKLQNVIARARPRGIMIEIGALEDISLGDGGEGGMKPIDILDMYTQTGLLVYRKISLDGAPSNYKPIEELDNGLGTEAQEYFSVIAQYMQKIRDMIGFNDITDGTTPDPKTLNGVASMAAEATNNALHHLFMAEKSLMEQVAEEVAIRVHDSIAFKKESPYQYVLGSELVKSIKENKKRIFREFSIALEYGSDQLEKQELNVSIEKALDQKQITLADKITIKRCRNLKQAEQILAYRIKKNEERAQAQQENLAMVNAKAQMEAAAKAEEERRKTAQIEIEGKIALVQAQKDADIEKMTYEHALKQQSETETNATKKDIEHIRKSAMTETAQIKKQLTPVQIPV